MAKTIVDLHPDVVDFQKFSVEEELMMRFGYLTVIVLGISLTIGCGKSKTEPKPEKEKVVQQMQIVKPDASSDAEEEHDNSDE